MIRDVRAWEDFERELARREPVNYQRNLELFEALLEEARALGRWPPDDPLEGIELDIRFAAALRALGKESLFPFSRSYGRKSGETELRL